MTARGRGSTPAMLRLSFLVSFDHKVRRTVTLSDGLTIPSGTFLSTPAYWTARDPGLFEGGEEFLPWRWFELREAAELVGKSVTPFLATSTSPENLTGATGGTLVRATSWPLQR